MQPRKLSALFKLRMIRRGAFLFLMVAIATQAFAQETPSTPRPAKRSWFHRILHPFSSSKPEIPHYKDSRLDGLSVEVQVSPQPVRLSEVRQLQVKTILKSDAKGPTTLDFPTDQRIEIYLMNTEGQILTKWSDNHAFNETPGLVMINPKEHVEYDETIATRDLTPNRVFIAQVFFPKYPELRARTKFLTAP
jgi:Intracellular proteinase inhibitor